MQDSHSSTDKVSNIDLHFNDLSGDQIFSFLKRYYNDTYPLSEEGVRTQPEGIYFEAIETLERLHHRLVEVSDFIGYAKIDWRDADTVQNKNKIKKIIDFYNDLVIDVDLMKVGMKGYDFAPKVKAFIHFVDSVENCRFRSDVQANPWTTEDFPHDEIFKTVDQFKQYFEERKKSYRPALIPSEWKEQAKEVEKAISKFKRITQALYVIKFSVADLSEDELARLTADIKIDTFLADFKPEQKLRDFIEWLSPQHIVGKLPWICTWTKAEIDIRRQVRFTIGMILDATDQELEPKGIEQQLVYDVAQQLERSWFEPFIVFDVVQLDQIFDQLGGGLIRNIKLPSKRKVDLMLKWYLGVFYQVDAIIRPSNLAAETGFADRPVILKINREKLERINHEQGRRAKVRTVGTTKPELNWNPTKLLKQVPKHFNSIHSLYDGLKNFGGLTNVDIEKLQKLNLFIAYLETTRLDGLQTTLKKTKPEKWADVAQIYLLLLQDWNSSYLELGDLTVCQLEPLDREFRGSPTIKDIQEDLESEKSLKAIVDALSRLKRALLTQEKVASLKVSTRLVEKNSQSAMAYLKYSFKQNSVLLRFKIDNFESDLELSTLKNLFTQFMKSIGRAPKRIGAELDAYIGYFVPEGKRYSIDCTAIFYPRDNVSTQDVRESFDDYWQDFIDKYVNTTQPEFDQLILSIIPTLWAEGGNSDPLVVNKTDKLIPQLKKDLVSFYTAYEYIRACKIAQNQGGKRPELFLRGRIRKPVFKDKEVKKLQQPISIVQSSEVDSLVDETVLITDNTMQQVNTEMIEDVRLQNDDSSNVVVDDHEQQAQGIVNKGLYQRALKMAASIEPLIPKKHE